MKITSYYIVRSIEYHLCMFLCFYYSRIKQRLDLNTKLQLILPFLILSKAYTCYASDLIGNETLLHPNDTLELITKNINESRGILTFDNISLFEDKVLSLVSNKLFLPKEELKKYDELSFHIDGSEIYYSFGIDSKEKLKALIEQKNRKLNELTLGKSERSKTYGVVNLTQILSTCEQESDDFYQARYTIVQDLNSDFSHKDPEESYIFKDKDTKKLDSNERDLAGCEDVVVETKIYQTSQNGQIDSLQRNVEVDFAGYLRSINDNGYVYIDNYHGDLAVLKGFVDEVRFISSFEGEHWRLNDKLVSPSPDVYRQCESGTDFGVEQTSGWNLGADATGNIGDDNVMSLSFSGGYDKSRTISTNSHVSCKSDLFRVDVGSQSPKSNYHDTLLDSDKSHVFYSSLQLANIGNSHSADKQSFQPYNIGNRSVSAHIDNLNSFAKSLDRNNASKSPQISLTPMTWLWPYDVSEKHKPFYSNHSNIIPVEVRNGFTHNANVSYFQPYHPGVNRKEVVSHRIETWYNPGYQATWLHDVGAKQFGLNFIIDNVKSKTDPILTKKVVLKLPDIEIDWLDQRLVSVRTLGIRSSTESSTFISKKEGQINIEKINGNDINYSQPFPLSDGHVFYMTNLLTGNENDKFQAIEINTYHVNDENNLVKQCLGINESDQVEIMACGTSVDGYSKTVWTYPTTSYLLDFPIPDLSDYTLCLRDFINTSEQKCLAVGKSNNLVVGDYSEENLGQTSFQWDLVDLSANNVPFIKYFYD